MNNQVFIDQGKKARRDEIPRPDCPYHRATRQAGLWWMGWDAQNLAQAHRAAADAGTPRHVAPFLKPAAPPAAIALDAGPRLLVRPEPPEGWNARQLRDLIDANLAVGHVTGRIDLLADYLGRGVSDVEAALDALQLRVWRDGPRHWGAAAVVDLLDRAERGESNAVIAASMGRPLDGIKWKLRELRLAGVRITRPHIVNGWKDPAADAELIRRCMAGESNAEIAKAMDRTERSVGNRIGELRKVGIPLPDRRGKPKATVVHAAAE
jgi:hypothetical protein